MLLRFTNNSSQILLFLFLLLATQGVAQDFSTQTRRPVVPDDLFRTEGVGTATCSPDGKWFALEILRAPGASPIKRLYLNMEAARTDLWIISREGAIKTKLTGLLDGKGYSRPKWSPDSKLLSIQ